MEKVLNKIECKRAEVILEEDHLIRIVIKEHNDIGVEDIMEFQEAKKKLLGNARHILLFVAPKYGELSKEGRELSASPLVNENAIAKVVVAKNIASSIVGNFFIKIYKPPVPIKLFKNEEEGIKWLREMQKKDSLNRSEPQRS